MTIVVSPLKDVLFITYVIWKIYDAMVNTTWTDSKINLISLLKTCLPKIVLQHHINCISTKSKLRSLAGLV